MWKQQDLQRKRRAGSVEMNPGGAGFESTGPESGLLGENTTKSNDSVSNEKMTGGNSSGNSNTKGRHTLVFLCSLCTALSYCDRVNMSVAVVDMAKEYEWSMAQRAGVLSAFFSGYVWSQIPAAFVAQKFGGHIVLGTCALFWSLATLAVPILAEYSHRHVIYGRIALGLFEGVVFPVIYHLFSSRIPSDERSRSIASLSTGIFAGAIFSFMISPILMHRLGWRSVFYFFGFLGVLWSLLWFWFCFYIEAKSGQYIPCVTKEKEKGNEEQNEESPSTSISTYLGQIISESCQIMCHKPVIAIFWAHFSHNCGTFVMMSWLPSYFEEEFGLSGSSLGLTCVPYIAMSIAVALSSKYADSFIQNGSMSLCEVRRFSTISGFVGAGTFMLLIGTTTWPFAAIFYMSVALAFNATGPVSGYEAMKLDVASPEYVGRLQSISNTIAAFAGVLGVPLVAYIKEYHGGWLSVFVTMGFVFYMAAFVFYFLGHYHGKVVF